LKSETRTIILYEAPHRIISLLKDLLEALGNRKIAISRELTKIHEETFRGTIQEAIEKFESQNPKGEFVLVVEGTDVEEQSFDHISIKEHIKMYMDEGLSKKESIKRWLRREIFQRVRYIGRVLICKKKIPVIGRALFIVI